MSPRGERSRGPDPEDAVAFAASQHARLRDAISELSWLLSRGYAEPSARKIVGDRHQLTQRQRLAVGQCACADDRLAARRARQLGLDELVGRAVRVDGFNCVITLEAALSGAALLVGRDGVWRDLSRVRGSYHPVAVTERVAALVGSTLAAAGAGPVEWCLDRPVSNSGRLKLLLLTAAGAAGWPWTVALTDGTDRVVAAAPDVVASSDSWILDRDVPWIDLPAMVLQQQEVQPWLVRLTGGE
ncbi:MAG: DUF434 domain-containing protein [Deltaproteobacteria bacterium HGW-Deltaproteobacteria-14]|jgi:hypothetical protein|nr:MAG: DUF434 domain-containing protein [Deltaproteobacteria bacterium HGW-Deltaproteobacteria-14]